MVETDPVEGEHGLQNERFNRVSDLHNHINSAPVTWIGRTDGTVNNTFNTGCPIKVDTSHPLWQTFLDSGTVSPLAFFRIFLSPPTYFNSPTPWRRSTRFVQKVQELLESFRPGTYVYQPFQKESVTTISNVESNRHEELSAQSSCGDANVISDQTDGSSKYLLK